MSTVTKKPEKIDSLNALLKTDNVFLFIPNIIGKTDFNSIMND